MATRELKRLSRKQLLQLLIAQMEENRDLRRKLENRQLIMENTGTLAEAALKLSGIFEAADAAAQIYLESVERIALE